MHGSETDDFRIAVFLPCLNEAATIGQLVRDIRRVMPTARVIVCDNMSTDETATKAKAAGAEVLTVRQRGKGNVVATAFAEIEADVYVMADGDGTYDPAEAPMLIKRLVEDRLDMVVGARQGVTSDAGRKGHAFGNRLFNWLFRQIFRGTFEDIFSGYRVFSRRFVRSFPALSTGFEIETELSVHALIMRLPVDEVPVSYGRRPEGSHSKLSTVHDGVRILSMFMLLMKEVRPFAFFNITSGITLLLSAVLATPVIAEYFRTGLVERFPTWILATVLLVIAFILFACGVILDSVARGRLERKRLAMLATPRKDPTLLRIDPQNADGVEAKDVADSA